MGKVLLGLQDALMASRAATDHYLIANSGQCVLRERWH